MKANLSFLVSFFVFHSIFSVPHSATAQHRGMKPVLMTVEGTTTTLYKQSYALLIGVANYSRELNSLPGVRSDIKEVETALENNGFNVEVVMNPDRTEMDRAFTDFIGKYGQDVESRLLFYFAGHGYTKKMSYGDDMGFLLPADAIDPNKNPNTFQSKALPMTLVETYALQIQSKHALFLFDACFSGEIFSPSRAVPEAITYKTTQQVRQFITSGSANETVPDKSIFRRQFIRALNGEGDLNKDGYMTGTELGDFLQYNVITYSYNTQHPQYGKIRRQNLDQGDFVFVMKTAALPSTPVQPIAKEEVIEESPIIGSIELITEIDGSLYIDGVFRRIISANNLYTLNHQSLGEHALKITGEENWEGTVAVGSNGHAKVVVKKKSGPEIIDMVLVKGGTFLMGCNDDHNNEEPVHSVNLNDFYIGKYEVTQKQWRDVMRINPSSFFGCDDCPVEEVNWNDVQKFIIKLNQKNGKNYRLPTEAEWEFAARGGNKSRIYTYSGSNNLDDVAWHSSNSRMKTHPVGMKQPNELGIYDMSGNVWEWCGDWYGSDYYQTSPSNNPIGPANGSARVLRGGAWNEKETFQRVVFRISGSPSIVHFGFGFRLARTN